MSSSHESSSLWPLQSSLWERRSIWVSQFWVRSVSFRGRFDRSDKSTASICLCTDLIVSEVRTGRVRLSKASCCLKWDLKPYQWDLPPRHTWVSLGFLTQGQLYHSSESALRPRWESISRLVLASSRVTTETHMVFPWRSWWLFGSSHAWRDYLDIAYTPPQFWRKLRGSYWVSYQLQLSTASLLLQLPRDS